MATGLVRRRSLAGAAEPRRAPKTQLQRWAQLTGAVLVFDLLSKWATATGGRDIGLIKPRLNTEFSLGVLSTATNPFVLALCTLAIAAMIAHAAALTVRNHLGLWATAFIIGGATANFADRAATGAVHDWLSIGPIIINIADIAVVAGLVGYLRCSWKLADRDD